MFEGFVEVPGGKLHCKFVPNTLAQENPSTILVLPGGPGFGYEMYEKHSGCFVENANMLFFDPRGAGKSTLAKNINDYTLDNYVTDAKLLIDHFNLKKVIVLGTSYGSMAALNFAIRHPESVEKLILVGGAPSHHFIEAAKEELEKRGNLEQKKIGAKLLAGHIASEEERQHFFQIMASLYSNKAKRESNPLYRAKCALDPLKIAFRTRFEYFDYREELKNITAETLILVGEDDWINPVSQAKITAQKIKHSILLIINDASHSIAVDQPDIYRNAIRYFISTQFLFTKEPNSFLEAAMSSAEL